MKKSKKRSIKDSNIKRKADVFSNRTMFYDEVKNRFKNDQFDQDDRFFRFEPVKLYRDTDTRLARIEKRGFKKNYAKNVTEAFVNPLKAVVCRRRRKRRQILFRVKRIGKGVRLKTPRRWIDSSSIKC